MFCGTKGKKMEISSNSSDKGNTSQINFRQNGERNNAGMSGGLLEVAWFAALTSGLVGSYLARKEKGFLNTTPRSVSTNTDNNLRISGLLEILAEKNDHTWIRATAADKRYNGVGYSLDCDGVKVTIYRESNKQPSAYRVAAVYADGQTEYLRIMPGFKINPHYPIANKLFKEATQYCSSPVFPE